jgi:hypothetical protein
MNKRQTRAFMKELTLIAAEVLGAPSPKVSFDWPDELVAAILPPNAPRDPAEFTRGCTEPAAATIHYEIGTDTLWHYTTVAHEIAHLTREMGMQSAYDQFELTIHSGHDRRFFDYEIETMRALGLDEALDLRLWYVFEAATYTEFPVEEAYSLLREPVTLPDTTIFRKELGSGWSHTDISAIRAWLQERDAAAA